MESSLTAGSNFARESWAGQKKNINKETPSKQTFHEIVPGVARVLLMCFPFRPQHINRFDPHPFPGQS